MVEVSENLTESELFKKALLIVHRLKSSGLDRESIYARLEKQGIPMKIAKEVVENVFLEKKNEKAKNSNSSFQLAAIRVGVGVALAVLSMILLPGLVIIPIGLILGGVVSAIIISNK